MNSHPIRLGTAERQERLPIDKEYSFIEALSLGPRESFSLVSKEKLGLPPSPSTPSLVGGRAPSLPRPSSSSFVYNPIPRPPSPPPPPPPQQLQSALPITHQRQQQHLPQQQRLPRSVTTKRSNQVMAGSIKAQQQCLELCHKTTGLGDRISVHMLEYLTSVERPPHGLNQLAHDFLDTCEVLFSIEAGLNECIRNQQAFPADVISELGKKFRVTQADFQVMDNMLNKNLEYERKGTMGRMKRGFSKMFGGDDVDKIILGLARTRESLKMSALMFQWSLGTEKIENEMGIGYTGLAAALDRLDHRAAVTRSKSEGHRSTNSSQHRGVEGHGTHLHPPLPPLPWAERSASLNHDSAPMSPVSDHHRPDPMSPTSDHHRQQHYPNQINTASSISSNERYHSGTTATFDRMSTFDESHETRSHADNSDNEQALEELAGIDLNAQKAVKLKADPLTMPRWVPRNTAGADAANLRSALMSAIRGKNHKLVEQLLDRGVSANTGADMHALKEAVMYHDAESVRLLLLFGADPNAADRDGVTPLFAAVEKSFLAGAVHLLKYGADPNFSISPDHETPLAASAMATKVNFSHLLLIYGGEPNHVNAKGDTILISAINKKTPKKFIDLILDYGADPDAKSREGKTALFEAITTSRVDIVTSLLEHGASANLPGPKHPLWPATYQSPCLQALLDHGADHKKAPGIMELAASVNNLESVRILLKAGVDPNAKKDGVYTPLCTAIRDNRTDIFNLLLSNGADPNVPASEYPCFKCITHNRVHFLPALVTSGAKLSSPKGIIETAVTCNNMEALNWLLDQGMNPNDKSPKGQTPLTSAIRDNRIDIVGLLLARGADPNIRGQDWPVCMAVRNPPILKKILNVLAEPRAFKGVMEMAVVANQLESVKLLLAAGVSVEDKNGGVFSPLTTAIREDRKDIVHYLLTEGGADINAPGEHLPIVKAVRRFHGEDSDIIEMLLEHGANPNKMYRGWNAIMQAVENGDPDVLRILCSKGVDPDAKDELGRTVAEIAASRGWDEAVAIIEEGGKKKEDDDDM